MAGQFRAYIAEETGKTADKGVWLTDGINNVLELDEEAPHANGQAFRSKSLLHLVHKLSRGEEFRVVHLGYDPQTPDELMETPIYRVVDSYELSDSEFDKLRGFIGKNEEECIAGIRNINEAFLPRERTVEESRINVDREAAIIENEKRDAFAKLKPVPKLYDAIIDYLRKK